MARPRRYDHDALRTRTIEAAKLLLEEGGPAALTARALASAVKTTPGTIYNLFDSMSAVLQEVNRQALVDLAIAVDAVRETEPRERLLALAEVYVTFMLDRRAVWRALFEGPRISNNFPDWYLAQIDGLIGRITQPVAALKPKGDPRLLAEQLLLSVHGIVALAAIDRLDLITRQKPMDLAHAAVERMIAAIRAGAE
ncbi:MULTISPECIES: TetR/AcrR family transcriptional regulator [Paracoccus]|uniref:TetR family transcriptional regulator n=1 Tax=Paracoccus versutus TaxID=34007 RepID=A0A369TZ31_PARVE|nr:MULTISPECIES: TetR/AcrR family transcriptional regulator [Paracoccus]WGR59995.1 TetR/AcrR family transcriptional regulator [Paracoccus ferrooxidans]SFX80609.1 transcriptional regulator, TetR family [Paracoccus pantotrophus]MBT0778346.1 TetR/AcrR family transcriptional regulator [Paracoccus sp. pheM1]RDD70410.1 TetR/AcrR family transcriptional regulator [Paracoccus versutus]REF70239.1 TetR family transcriptional regulator [Paracoccus versutus]